MILLSSQNTKCIRHKMNILLNFEVFWCVYSYKVTHFLLYFSNKKKDTVDKKQNPRYKLIIDLKNIYPLSSCTQYLQISSFSDVSRMSAEKYLNHWSQLRCPEREHKLSEAFPSQGLFYFFFPSRVTLERITYKTKTMDCTHML